MNRAVKLRDLVVLGLLREHPRYGYEIKTIIDNVMSHVIDVSSGSLYYGLKKLQEGGLVDEAAVEKIGRRPERSVYRITDAGIAFLNAELPQVVFPRAQPYFPLDLALYFFKFLDPLEEARRLMMRLEHIKLLQKYMSHLQDDLAGVAPPNQLLIITHHMQFSAMERRFIQEVLEKLLGDVEYTLTEADYQEVVAEFEQFKRQVKLEAVLPEAATLSV